MATINVTVKDRNTNLGIAGGIIVLFDNIALTQTTAITNTSGVASFTNVAIGSYSVYNTWIAPNATPPTICGFPSGYTGTTYARRLDVSVTLAGQTTALNFNFDKPVPWSSINGGNPPNAAFTLSVFVNLANGALSPITPNIINNGMGYSTADNMIYGSSGRSDTTTTVALNYPLTYTISSVIGDCDTAGHFYTYATSTSFTCIDVDPTRTTYLRPVNPYTNFSEVTTSPYTVSYTNSASAITLNDWSYVPKISSIVTMSGANTLFVLSLTTPNARNVSTTGPSLVSGGVTFSDSSNFYEPTGTQILKYFMTTTVGIGSVLANSAAPNSGDGARAVTTPVFYAQAIPHKAVSEYYGTYGDTLIYTVTVTNTGNTTAVNVYLQDTLPDGISFVVDTVKVNGISQPTGTTPNFVEIGTLPLNTVYTITFNALVNTNTLTSVSNTANINTTAYDSATLNTISSSFISNSVTTTLANASLLPTKSVSKTYASPGDTLIYTITIANTNNTTLSNVILVDTTPSSTTFIPGSVNLNGVTVPSATLFPTGLNVGTIGVGVISTVTFMVVTTSIVTTNPIPNSASTTYTYTIDSTTTPTRTGSGGINTNVVNTSIVYADLSGRTKFVDKVFATCGDIITYTIIIPNNGNVTAINVILADTVPDGTVFVDNSIFINGVASSATSPISIPIGNITPGGTTTVSFSVRIKC